MPDNILLDVLVLMLAVGLSNGSSGQEGGESKSGRFHDDGELEYLFEKVLRGFEIVGWKWLVCNAKFVTKAECNFK